MNIRIESKEQLVRARASRAGFQGSLDFLEKNDRPADIDPELYRASIDSLNSVIREFDEEIARFEGEVSSAEGL